MKKTDYFGIAFLVLLVLLVVFFPVNHTVLAKLTRDGCFVNGSFEWTGFTLKGLDQFGNVTRIPEICPAGDVRGNGQEPH